MVLVLTVLVPRVPGRGGAAGPGKGRAQGGVEWARKGMLGTLREADEAGFQPSVPACVGGCSHGPPYGKRLCTPTLPYPNPIPSYEQNNQLAQRGGRETRAAGRR